MTSTVERPASTTPVEPERFGRLRRLNLAMAGLHLAQAALMLALANGFSLPLTAAYLRSDPGTGTLVGTPERLATVRIGPLVAGFLLLSALAHLTVALPRVSAWYDTNLRRGANYARWAEYSLSSSLMLVVIAMLVGIYDVAALLLLVGCNAAMIFFGWVMEAHHAKTARTDWTSYVFGCVAGVVPWVAIGLYLAGAGGPGSEVPAFVYWIYGSIFLFFNVFAVNMLLQYRRVGRWRDYLYGERAYIALSLVAKSLLAWQVFAGTLRPA